MKRRLLALILAGVTVCSLTACGGKNSGNSNESAETSAEGGATQMSIALRGGV